MSEIRQTVQKDICFRCKKLIEGETHKIDCSKDLVSSKFEEKKVCSECLSELIGIKNV